MAALLVSCFTLFSSAEVPEISVDDLNSLFEYHYYKDNVDSNGVNGYFQSNYEAYAAGATDEVKYPDAQKTNLKLSNFAMYQQTKASIGASYVITDPADADNKILVYRKVDANKVEGQLLRYILGSTNASAANFTDKLVLTFDIKLSGADGYFSVRINNKAYFTIDISDPDNAAFSYEAYDPKVSENATIHRMQGLTPSRDTWYTVQSIMNFEANKLTIDVFERDNPENKATTGDVMFSPGSCNIVDNSGNVGAKLVELHVEAKNTGESQVYFDNIKAYEGTLLRDIENPDKAINSFLVEVDELANSEATSLEKKIEIAEFYEKVFYNEELGMKYVPLEDADEAVRVERVNAMRNGAKSYFNTTYAKALIEFTDKLENDKSVRYYDRMSIYEGATVFYDFFFNNGYSTLFDYEEGQLDSLDKFVGIENLIDDLYAAAEIYSKELDKQEDIKNASIGFVDLMATFSTDAAAYADIANYVMLLERFADRDETFKYALELGITDENDPKYKYQTVAVAIEEYNVVKANLVDIDAKVKIFTDAVYAMKDAPVKTEGFAALYASYATASSVFSNGTVHPMLDMSTYPDVKGISMTEYVNIYNARGAYIAERTAECEEFIRLVEGASASAAHTGTLTFLDSAASYIDSDVNVKSVETDYPGINEAIATYNALRQKLADTVAAADVYKAAVNAIDMNASYAALKQSVEAALALKATGAVVGIDGIMEANIKLSEAESKVKTAEGNSTTLIESMNSYKNAKTVAERRELILIATKAAAGAEDSISGVSAAKTALAEATTQFNADVEAANAAFVTAMNNAVDTTASVADSDNAYKLADIIKALFKK